MDLSITPSLPPPPGVAPNFVNPYNINPLIDGTLGVCLGITSMLVISRLCTRFLIIKRHGLEDYSILLVWLGFIGYVALSFVGRLYGGGVHQWNVPLSKFSTFAQITNVLEVYYNPLIFLTKLSILVQYLHIFCPSKGGVTYWAILVLIGANFLFYVAVMLVQIMTCLPRKKIWNPTVPGRCVNLPAVLISGAAVNVVSDVSMLVLPIYKIWQLQMSNARRWGVSAIFASGLFACISSIMRLVNNVEFSQTKDVTFNLVPVALWTMAEITSGIICACLPVMPQLFRHSLPLIRSSFVSTFRKSSAGFRSQSRSRSRKGERDASDDTRAFYELSDQVHMTETKMLARVP